MTIDIFIIVLFGFFAYFVTRGALEALREKCTHPSVKSVLCELDEDGKPSTNHYENTCQICGKVWLHTPIREKRKRKTNRNKSTKAKKNKK